MFRSKHPPFPAPDSKRVSEFGWLKSIPGKFGVLVVDLVKDSSSGCGDFNQWDDGRRRSNWTPSFPPSASTSRLKDAKDLGRRDGERGFGSQPGVFQMGGSGPDWGDLNLKSHEISGSQMI